MELSWNEIEELWKKHGGTWGAGRVKATVAQMAAFCQELTEIVREVTPLEEIAPDDVHSLYERLQDLEQRGYFVSQDVTDSALLAVENALRKKLNRPDGDFVLGTWECEGESPTGDCIYDLDDEELNGEDECMFCHEPNERK